jgi:regulator of protease activity HflC (stomatin/prohibitin superfamily)
VGDLIELLPVLAIAALVIFSLVGAAVKVVQEYERGVIFRLGRLVGAKGPGLFFIIPFIDRMVKIDLRTVTLDIPSQEAITRDNVTVRVNAVAYFRVVDPEAAVVRVENYMMATMQIAQTTMRSVLGQSELDELLSNREEINARLQQIIDQQTEPWGIKVSVVEVKDVELPQTMQRAMARQAEAERDKRAKVIHAEGEFLAAEQLSNAANIISAAPSALQLRYLQTLGDISSDQTRTIIFPLPMDLISAFIGGNKGEQSGAAGVKPVIPPASGGGSSTTPSADEERG